MCCDTIINTIAMAMAVALAILHIVIYSCVYKIIHLIGFSSIHTKHSNDSTSNLRLPFAFCPISCYFVFFSSFVLFFLFISLYLSSTLHTRCFVYIKSLFFLFVRMHFFCSFYSSVRSVRIA